MYLGCMFNKHRANAESFSSVKREVLHAFHVVANNVTVNRLFGFVSRLSVTGGHSEL